MNSCVLAQDRIFTMPCCYDGLSARMVAQAGFELTFMTGFGVSAVHGYPDTQVLSIWQYLAIYMNNHPFSTQRLALVVW